MKEDFEASCDFFRDAARDMYDKEKCIDQVYQTPTPAAPAYRTPYAQRGRDGYAPTVGNVLCYVELTERFY